MWEPDEHLLRQLEANEFWQRLALSRKSKSATLSLVLGLMTATSWTSPCSTTNPRWTCPTLPTAPPLTWWPATLKASGMWKDTPVARNPTLISTSGDLQSHQHWIIMKCVFPSRFALKRQFPAREDPAEQLLFHLLGVAVAILVLLLTTIVGAAYFVRRGAGLREDNFKLVSQNSTESSNIPLIWQGAYTRIHKQPFWVRNLITKYVFKLFFCCTNIPVLFHRPFWRYPTEKEMLRVC